MPWALGLKYESPSAHEPLAWIRGANGPWPLGPATLTLGPLYGGLLNPLYGGAVALFILWCVPIYPLVERYSSLPGLSKELAFAGNYKIMLEHNN